MNRDAVARARRKREVEELLEFERDRETALLDQIEVVVLEEEGVRIDLAARALLAPADVDLLDDILAGAESDEEDEDDPNAGFVTFELDDQDDPAEDVDEVSRLQAEVERCRARQAALGRLAALLDAPLEAAAEPGSTL